VKNLAEISYRFLLPGGSMGLRNVLQLISVNKSVNWLNSTITKILEKK